MIKKTKLTISGIAKKSIENIELAKTQSKNSVVIENSEDIKPTELIWIIQIAAFENYQEAEILSKELERKSFNVFISQKDIASKTLYRVRIKPKAWMTLLKK